MAKIELNKENLDKIFEYKDGDLFWKEKPSSTSKSKIGDKANRLNTDYLGERFSAVKIGGTAYRLNKLIYTMFHGNTPMKINHIDGNRLNNKIENLESGIKIKL